jgi:hypothetical protein
LHTARKGRGAQRCEQIEDLGAIRKPTAPLLKGGELQRLLPRLSPQDTTETSWLVQAYVMRQVYGIVAPKPDNRIDARSYG